VRLTAAVVVWIVLVGALGWWLGSSQQSSRAGVLGRLQARVELGANFAALYVRDFLDREWDQARVWLSGPHVTATTFDRVSSSLDLNTALLLDNQGQLLAITPSNPQLIGTVLATPYAHLAQAVDGDSAVSNVISSAGSRLPLVAFAVPFQTAGGKRVFSGGYDLANTPLGAYLNQMTSIPGRATYTVDEAGELIAGGSVGRSRAETLAEADPNLATAVAHASQGTYDEHGTAEEFITQPVPGTPWRIVLRVPQSQLYASISGATRWLPWVAFGGLAGAGILVIMLISGLRRRRGELVDLNRELDGLAHLDSLTGLCNRRAMEAFLKEELASARRHDHGFAVLMIDLDHFKRINDTIGHGGGDSVLVSTARAFERNVRVEDTVARWGGEEFLALLPFTDQAGAMAAAERLQEAINEVRHAPSSELAPLTTTIGVAVWEGEDIDELLKRADTALYAGKLAGRNVIQPAPSAGRQRPAPSGRVGELV
jgi:diguanylate cyclase (GGDEF)-like protein